MKYIYKIIILLFTITLTFSSCESLTYDENIQKGDEAYQSFLLQDKDLEVLAKLLDVAMDEFYVWNPEKWRKVADSIYEQEKKVNQKKNGYKEEAIKYYNNAIDIDPDNTIALLKLAIAEKDYNKIIELDPNNSEAYNAEAYWLRALSLEGDGYVSIYSSESADDTYAVWSDAAIADLTKAMEIDIEYFDKFNEEYGCTQEDMWKMQGGVGNNKFIKLIDSNGNISFVFSQMMIDSENDKAAMDLAYSNSYSAGERKRTIQSPGDDNCFSYIMERLDSSNKKLIGYYQNGNKYTVQYLDMRRNIQGVGVYTTDENCQIIATN